MRALAASGERSTKVEKASIRCLMPLRIIEPVNADYQLPAFETGAGAPHDRVAVGDLRFMGEGLGVDADRQSRYLEAPAEGLNELTIDDTADFGMGEAPGQIGSVARRLHADEIIGGETPQDALVTGEHCRHLMRRPGNMHEEADAIGTAELAQIIGKRDQVIIVNPDDVVGFNNLASLRANISLTRKYPATSRRESSARSIR